jgi:hypothetical protein
MTLHVDSGALDLLYGPRLKLVVAAADAERARLLQNQGSEDLAEPGLVLFQPATEEQPPHIRVLEAPEPADLAPLPAPPSGLCVPAALSPQGRTHLKDFLAWWREHGADSPPPLLDLSNEDAAGPAGQQAALYRHLTRIALHEVTRGAQRQTELTGQLYELRLEQEQGRVALEALQNLVGKLEKAPCHLAFQLLPTGAVYRPEGGCYVRQLLPVGGEGLAGIDLHVPSWPERAEAEGTLVVTLRSRERETTLGTWALSYKDLGRGWARCSLPTALTQPLHHLEIDVVWHTVHGTPPPLSLAETGPWHELNAQAGDRRLNKALAVLAWAATPGAKVGLARATWAPAEDAALPGGYAEFRITPADVYRIRLTTPNVAQPFEAFGESGFRLHPLGPTPVCAMLPRLGLPGIVRVVAIGQINHEQARLPVEYAMCLTDAAAGCTTMPESPETDLRVLGFSGWQTVMSDRLPHAIVLELSRPLEVQADLHFATRVTEGSPYWLWADWTELRVGLRYGA